VTIVEKNFIESSPVSESEGTWSYLQNRSPYYRESHDVK